MMNKRTLARFAAVLAFVAVNIVTARVLAGAQPQPTVQYEEATDAEVEAAIEEARREGRLIECVAAATETGCR